jgi:hypothetical protein
MQANLRAYCTCLTFRDISLSDVPPIVCWISSVTWRNVSEAQRRELEDAPEWSLRKIEENRKADI